MSGNDVEAGGPPAFICGLGRSGTTLLRNLLDGHPDLLVLPGESRYYISTCWSRPTTRRVMFAWEMIEPTTASFAMARPPLAWLRTTEKEVWAPTLKAWYFAWAGGAARPVADIDDAIAKADGPLAFWKCALQLLRTAKPHLSTSGAWLEKTPSTERFVGLIERDFNRQARYLHVVRDPRAVCASRVRDPYRRQTTSRKDLLAGACYDWSLSVRLAAHLAQRLEGRHLVLRFEDLTADPRRVMAEVATFLRIAFRETLLQPTLFGVPTVIYSSYEPIRAAKGIEPAPMERVWGELTMGEVATVQRLLAGQMAAMGYEARPADAPLESWARTGRPLAVARRWAMARRQHHGLPRGLRT